MRISALTLLLTLSLGAVARAEPDALVRVHVDDARAARRDWERLGVQVVGADPSKNTVDVLAPPAALDALLARDPLRVLAVESHDPDRVVRALRQYRRPAQVKQVLDQVVQAAPSVATLEDLTPEGLFEGQHIYAVRLMSKRGASPKPTVLFTCQIHAGESSTTEVCLDIVTLLSGSYGREPLVTRWLDAMEVWVVPMVNPDGVEHAMDAGEHWRKNRNPSCPVDLNRNFASTFDACDGASVVCPADDFRGTAALSEPETQALRALLLRIRPRFHVDYHEFGEDITYPGGCGPVERDAQLAALAQGLREVIPNDDGLTGTYDVGTLESTVYPVSGSLMDESYQQCGTLSFLFEIGRSFAPDVSRRDGIVVRQRPGWQFLLSAVLQCQPDQVCTVTPDPVVGGEGCGCSTTAGLPLAPLVLLGLLARRTRRR